MRRRNVRNAHERILKYENIILHPNDLLNINEDISIKNRKTKNE